MSIKNQKEVKYVRQIRAQYDDGSAYPHWISLPPSDSLEQAENDLKEYRTVYSLPPYNRDVINNSRIIKITKEILEYG